ncbi:MAG: transcription antitermination factor NusB [Acidimicrobiales bacterium]
MNDSPSTNAPKKAGGPKRKKTAGSAARRVAIGTLVRIEKDRAYANLALGPLLNDRASTTRPGVRLELVYGTTRMKRACDYLVDGACRQEVGPQVGAALRIGAYQLQYLDLPVYGVIDATVGAVKGPGRGLVNAVLRRVARADVEWPNDGVRLSYPDWLVAMMRADLGVDLADAALTMNERAVSHVRSDGYVQDLASQEVVRLCAAEPGERVLDLCAAPGGKATGLALAGAVDRLRHSAVSDQPDGRQRRPTRR